MDAVIDDLTARITGDAPVVRQPKDARRKPTVEIIEGDCREVLKELSDNSVDAVVTDPPYALTSEKKGGTGVASLNLNSPAGRARVTTGFMGKAWDTGETAFDPAFWQEVLRVLKPGGHVLAFGGSRTYHKIATAIDDAGFEIRDQIMWIYGSGFPKSSNQTDDWEGWGTALKPAHEPVVAGYKPVTVAQHFAMIGEEITLILAEETPWSNASASDAEKSFIATLAKCREAAGSVLDGARMRSLESIGIAPSAARSSTFSELASFDWTRTKDCSVLSHVRPNGSLEETKGSKTPSGAEAAILTRLADTCTSVMMAGMSESTALLWPSILDDLLSQASRFTTETVSRLTTALKTFNCLLPQSTTDDTGNLSPNHRPIVVARKPLIGTVPANLAKYGVGALNIDGCRVGFADEADKASAFPGGRLTAKSGSMAGKAEYLGCDDYAPDTLNPVEADRDICTSCFHRAADHRPRAEFSAKQNQLGRWPANVIHDGSDEVLAAFPQARGAIAGTPTREIEPNVAFGRSRQGGGLEPRDQGGSAARFFYCAKTSKADRDDGLTTPETPVVTFATANGTSGKPSSISEGRNTAYKNTHPTVKPTSLMRYLCRLVTPPNGTVLDPFMGSGSTGRGAVLEGFDFIGIEMDAAYYDIADARIAAAEKEAAKSRI